MRGTGVPAARIVSISQKTNKTEEESGNARLAPKQVAEPRGVNVCG